ncbi:DNA polymerase III subunit epsilon [Candidatus Methylospira mobilis]|uniref:DNA polymerase III subunit epsilon n=1 Tax=Candidatus Methylospira mobilis TaxID=1808979 RepID=UPI0028F0CC74|nr:DNA polymerase III subunit epsilon [Candidatus Methylospira mobilis]WNV03591.1 DNA polymerase III subunit epsilon [Candidatus Methylospira mobilis]
MKQIVLDTETTGLSPDEGHRIIEIGCVELIARKPTGNRFHVYLNPEREIDQGAIDVHGLDNAFLSDKPRFSEICADFLDFVQGAELVIHNAAFDVGFLNAELKRVRSDFALLESYCSILDTLALARKMHPGQRNSLDALCKRYDIDNRHRDLHGALLDAEILADVYLAMTGGQMLLLLDDGGQGHATAGTNPAAQSNNPSAPANMRRSATFRVIPCEGEELLHHEEKLDAIDRYCGNTSAWRR